MVPDKIEKIRQEIERRIEQYWSDGDVDSVVVSSELEEILDFLDTLQGQTDTDSKKLEKEINKWLDGPSTDLRTMARHFAEWGAEHLK